MDFNKLPIGEKAPEIINVVVEIPRGSHNKYEFDEELGVFKLDRVLYSPVHYPLDYGFIPETRSEDGDHLDCLIIGSDPVPQGCVVKVRPVALLKMIDSGDLDMKVLGVQADNPRLNTLKDLDDLMAHNEHLLKEISHFFTVYKHLQGKETQVEDWTGRDAALAEIKRSQEMFKKES